MANGPRATDVLANERTFLAYVRTSLSFIAFGFVVARFALFAREISGILHLSGTTQHLSTEFGTAVAFFGAFVGAYGGYRYVAADRAMKNERVVALSQVAVAIGAGAVVAIGCGVGIGLIAFH